MKRTPLKRKTPLRKQSRKAKQITRELAKLLPPEDGRCTDCKELPDWRGLSKHHILFRSHGGGNESSNIEWLCGKCHSLRHGIKEA